MNDFESYQKTAEKLKDDILLQNRKLLRQLAEKEQSFELVKMVHFDQSIDLRVLNDIIIGCTGCLHAMMFSNKETLSDLKEGHPVYQGIFKHRERYMTMEALKVEKDIIQGFTAVIYPVGSSDLVKDYHHKVRSIVMLYPNKLMDDEVLAFVKSFMIVNEVLINIVLTRERMMELIETDPLTKAYNRLSWRQNIKRYLYQGAPFFIMFVDLDDFKTVNDTHGHQKGDEVLKLTVAWLKSTFRPDDKVFRLGGDEFAVAGFLDMNEDQGFISKLKELNEAFRFTMNRFLKLEGSVSLGVLITSGGKTEEDVFSKTDELLYQSKTAGKGTITVYNEINA